MDKTFLQQTYSPAKALAPYVNYFWSLEIIDPTHDFELLKIFAEKSPRLVIQCMDGQSCIFDSDKTKLPHNFISGVASKKATYKLGNRYSHIAVCFYPGALKKLFGLDADETTNNVIELSHFMPFEIITQIVEARNHRKRIAILSGFLLKRVQAIKKEDTLVAHYLSNHFNMTYWQSLKNYKISERQFLRRFRTMVGVNPSTYKRIDRFEHSLELLSKGDFVKLSDIAYGLGYSDQSHFIREFRELSGFTPKEFLLQNRPIKENVAIVSAYCLNENMITMCYE